MAPYNALGGYSAGPPMDPVTKWLLLIGTFLSIFLGILFYNGTVGHYQMSVVPRSPKSDVVYVIDTRTGEVRGFLTDTEKFTPGASIDVGKFDRPGFSYR